MTLDEYVAQCRADLEKFRSWFTALPEHLRTNSLDIGDWDNQLEDWRDSHYGI